MASNTVNTLLGHDVIIKEALTILKDKKALLKISGPSGTGKSTLATQIGDQWTSSGNDLFCLAGDRRDRDVPLLPFKKMQRSKSFVQRLRGKWVEGVVESSKDIPFVGNSVAFLMQATVDEMSHGSVLPLSDQERDILSSIQRASTDKDGLLIVDDSQELDESTQKLLLKLFDERVISAYPALETMRIMLIFTTNQTGINQENECILQTMGKELVTQRPGRNVFYPLLKALGLSLDLDTNVLDALYAISGGHLKMTKEIVMLYGRGKDSLAELAGNPTLSEAARKIVSARIQALDQLSTPMRKLLGMMACGGNKLSRKEIECAFNDDQCFDAVFDIAVREEYLLGGDIVSFTHELVQRAIIDDGQPPAYHSKLEDCIRLICPGDYLRRFRHSVKADRQKHAQALATVILLKNMQGELLIASASLEKMLRSYAAPYDQTLAAAYKAIKAMDASAHDVAIEALLQFDLDEEGLVAAERAYLLALNYFKIHNEYGYESAQRVLFQWEESTNELEQWSRLMATQAVAYLHLGKFDIAQRLWLRVRKANRILADDDQSGNDRIMILHRQSPMFFPPELAVEHVKTAVNYFAPPPGASLPANVFQYTAAVTNYSGLLFCLGRYREAAKQGFPLIDFLKKIPDIRCVDKYKIINNTVISLVRSLDMSPSEGRAILEKTVMQDKKPFDRVLIISNIGALHLLSKNIKIGMQVLSDAFNHVVNENMDEYYYTYVASNLAAAHYFNRDKSTALQIWDTIPEFIEKFRVSEGALLKKRHDILSNAFKSELIFSVEEWDAFPQKIQTTFSSEAWTTYGRGILFSDIQVWSES